MSNFQRSHGVLHAEGVPLHDIAQRYGTPLYVYSKRALLQPYLEFTDALRRHTAETLVCYAVKANSNLAILRLYAEIGAGFDIVSGGEMARVIAAGGKPGKVVFSGVGKSEAEIESALAAGIHSFNVESRGELQRINEAASRLGQQAPVSFRVNPDVDPGTHPYIATGLHTAKFGVQHAEARALYNEAAAMAGIHVQGIACHIGSQLLDSAPMSETLERLLSLVGQLTEDGISLEHIDLGGGLGIAYRPEDNPPSIDAYLSPLLERLSSSRLALLVGPGRSLVGTAGVLLTRVEYLKHHEHKNFAIVDAAMNDCLRPVLYDAWHDIVPVEWSDEDARTYEIAGPVCETGDFLGKERTLSLQPGDLLAVLCAGAYGMSMSSNYNSRPRAAEVLVDGENAHLIRRRESIDDLLACEQTDWRAES